jgi:hypothetical protein
MKAAITKAAAERARSARDLESSISGKRDIKIGQRR